MATKNFVSTGAAKTPDSDRESGHLLRVRRN
jgi:hypothetical protein